MMDVRKNEGDEKEEKKKTKEMIDNRKAIDNIEIKEMKDIIEMINSKEKTKIIDNILILKEFIIKML